MKGFSGARFKKFERGLKRLPILLTSYLLLSRLILAPDWIVNRLRLTYFSVTLSHQQDTLFSTIPPASRITVPNYSFFKYNPCADCVATYSSGERSERPRRYTDGTNCEGSTEVGNKDVEGDQEVNDTFY